MTRENYFFVNKFIPGQCVATPGAMNVLAEHYVLPEDLLRRHVSGDWGDLDDEDKQRNEEALKNGARIFASYVLAEGVKVWIITEAINDIGIRSSTTILLPEEY